MTGSQLPAPLPDQAYVTVSPIGSQSITLPDKCFVSPSDPDASRSVPSLSFLITHPGNVSESSFGYRLFHRTPSEDGKSDDTVPEKPLRMLFDLGLRGTAHAYLPQQQEHLINREPYSLQPSVAETLRRDGNVRPEDIDLVVLSHVHYDHHGDPSNYPNARLLVGPGALTVLKKGLGGLASHQHFDPDLLPEDRTIELPEPPTPNKPARLAHSLNVGRDWAPLGPFPHTLDLFSDHSVYVVDAPGHLPGHVNLLCRIGAERWVYLAGDSAHDARLLTGEKKVGTWEDAKGRMMCIHLDKEGAEETIGRIKSLMREEGDRVEVALSHDEVWAREMRGRGCFYPGVLR